MNKLSMNLGIVAGKGELPALSAQKEVEKGFIQRITKDYYLEEAVYILSEM